MEGETPQPLRFKKLEGTYEPSAWVANTQYSVGDIVKPYASYNGYVYECTQGGTSGSIEPTWKEDLVSTISDGTAIWRGVGSLELEGSGATTLQAKCIGMYKGFLFVADTIEGIGEYPYRLRWS